MKEYVERQEAVNELNRIEALYRNTYMSTVRAEMVSYCCTVVDHIPAADVVPWEWLKRYANGKRMNYCSDFVLEAKEAWENEQGVH